MMDSSVGEKMPAAAGKKDRRKSAAIISCVFWGLSLVLSFSIPTGSPYIWLPDTVLLLGFFPLIWICPYSLIWLAFGIFTAAIGSILLVLTNIPDSALPAQSVPVKKHLAEYHPCWSWMILGILVTVCGGIRFLINSVLLFLRRYGRMASK